MFNIQKTKSKKINRINLSVLNLLSKLRETQSRLKVAIEAELLVALAGDCTSCTIQPGFCYEPVTGWYSLLFNDPVVFTSQIMSPYLTWPGTYLAIEIFLIDSKSYQLTISWLTSWLFTSVGKELKLGISVLQIQLVVRGGN